LLQALFAAVFSDFLPSQISEGPNSFKRLFDGFSHANKWKTGFSFYKIKVRIRSDVKIINYSAIDLTRMRLTGTIPPEMGDLSFLGWPRLGNSSFHGSISPLSWLNWIAWSASAFHSMTSLGRSHHGSGPSRTISQVPSHNHKEAMDLSANNLKELYMASNQLSGVTPPSIVNMYTMVQILGLNDRWHETIKDPRTHDQLWLGASFFKWTTGIL